MSDINKITAFAMLIIVLLVGTGIYCCGGFKKPERPPAIEASLMKEFLGK